MILFDVHIVKLNWYIYITTHSKSHKKHENNGVYLLLNLNYSNQWLILQSVKNLNCKYIWTGLNRRISIIWYVELFW